VNTQRQEHADVINFTPSQPQHCVLCGELLDGESDKPYDDDCEETYTTLCAMDRLVGDEPMWSEYHTAVSNAGILITGKDDDLETSVQRILLGLSQGLDPDDQKNALSALQHLGCKALASFVGSVLCVEGFSASLESAYLTFEDNELRLSECEPRKKASKLLREELGGDWVDTDRMYVFAPERETALALLRVCAGWYPLVQCDNEFLTLVEDEEFMDGEEEPEPEPDLSDEPAGGIIEGEEEGDDMQAAAELDEDLFSRHLSKVEKPLTRKAFRELVDMASKYDLALAELAPDDIKDPHLARLWEVYLASVGTALVADAAIDQYLDDRKAASEATEQKNPS
jgi:hypothetical protein